MLTSLKNCLLLLCAAWLCVPALAGDNSPNDNVTWALSDLYQSDSEWEKDFAKVSHDITQLPIFSAIDGDDPHKLATVLDSISDTKKALARLYTYASLKADSDLRNKNNQKTLAKIAGLYSRFSALTAYLTPEIATLGSSALDDFILRDTRLHKHVFNIKNMLRHADNQSEFKAMDTDRDSRNPHRDFLNLVTTRINWPAISLSTGEVAVLNQAGYEYYRVTSDRKDRKRVHDFFWRTVSAFEETLTDTLNRHVQSQVDFNGSNRQDKALKAKLWAQHIPVTVYTSMLDASNKAIPLLHKYLSLKKSLTGAKKMEYHDIYAEPLPSVQRFTLDDAKSITKTALKPLGREYNEVLETGFTSAWMDPYPRTGKRSGAYMQGAAYDVHPYILLNFSNEYRDVSDFVHEWGHAVHTVLANKNNPYETAGYGSFIAETAATTNEVLLQDHMINHAGSTIEKLYYVDQALGTFYRSFFRQTMLAEFEYELYKRAEKKGDLVSKETKQLYLDILRKYHGHNDGIVDIADIYGLEWAITPQLYNSFYVYQYATSIAAGVAIAEMVQSDDSHTTSDYLGMLKAGGSNHPYQVIRNAGIDLAKPDAYNALLKRFETLLNTANALLDQLKTNPAA